MRGDRLSHINDLLNGGSNNAALYHIGNNILELENAGNIDVQAKDELDQLYNLRKNCIKKIKPDMASLLIVDGIIKSYYDTFGSIDKMTFKARNSLVEYISLEARILVKVSRDDFAADAVKKNLSFWQADENGVYHHYDLVALGLFDIKRIIKISASLRILASNYSGIMSLEQIIDIANGIKVWLDIYSISDVNPKLKDSARKRAILETERTLNSIYFRLGQYDKALESADAAIDLASRLSNIDRAQDFRHYVKSYIFFNRDSDGYWKDEQIKHVFDKINELLFLSLLSDELLYKNLEFSYKVCLVVIGVNEANKWLEAKCSKYAVEYFYTRIKQMHESSNLIQFARYSDALLPVMNGDRCISYSTIVENFNSSYSSEEKQLVIMQLLKRIARTKDDKQKYTMQYRLVSLYLNEPTKESFASASLLISSMIVDSVNDPKRKRNLSWILYNVYFASEQYTEAAEIAEKELNDKAVKLLAKSLSLKDDMNANNKKIIADDLKDLAQTTLFATNVTASRGNNSRNNFGGKKSNYKPKEIKTDNEKVILRLEMGYRVAYFYFGEKWADNWLKTMDTSSLEGTRFDVSIEAIRKSFRDEGALVLDVAYRGRVAFRLPKLELEKVAEETNISHSFTNNILGEVAAQSVLQK